MRWSIAQKDPRLIRKDPTLFVAALSQIPVSEYGGLTLNGGMTFHIGRGLEVIEPVIRAVYQKFPSLPIAVEITPPADMEWIDRAVDAGLSSLMMNLECWDEEIRKRLIPGKNQACPKSQYFGAFERALKRLGPGRVSTCFVVGTEPMESLKEGIRQVVRQGVIPSPIAGRDFEDIPGYSFSARADWQEFIEVLRFSAEELRRQNVMTSDLAGCVACGMCDMTEGGQAKFTEVSFIPPFGM